MMAEKCSIGRVVTGDAEEVMQARKGGGKDEQGRCDCQRKVFLHKQKEDRLASMSLIFSLPTSTFHTFYVSYVSEQFQPFVVVLVAFVQKMRMKALSDDLGPEGRKAPLGDWRRRGGEVEVDGKLTLSDCRDCRGVKARKMSSCRNDRRSARKLLDGRTSVDQVDERVRITSRHTIGSVIHSSAWIVSFSNPPKPSAMSSQSS